MRAALYERYHEIPAITSVPDPICPPDGVIVRVEACGVCRSDHHAWAGSDPDVKPPHVPGHEFAGVVEEVGKETRRWKRKAAVTAPFILACGVCDECLRGDPTICDHQHVVGFSSWGAFAEYIAVPRADFNLVAMPEALGFAETASMGCRVTTAFRALVDRAGLAAGERLAVHGCGGVGLAAVMIGSALGARVIAIDVREEPLAKAMELGAEARLNAHGLSEAGNMVRELTGGGVDVSIDALGTEASFHQSLASLRKLGRHVQVGMPVGIHRHPTIPLLDLIYARQITLIGTRGIAASRFPALLELLEAGHLDLRKLISRRISLEEAGQALADMDGYVGTGITVIDRF